jgi:hypothetical protein
MNDAQHHSIASSKQSFKGMGMKYTIHRDAAHAHMELSKPQATAAKSITQSINGQALLHFSVEKTCMYNDRIMQLCKHQQHMQHTTLHIGEQSRFSSKQSCQQHTCAFHAGRSAMLPAGWLQHTQTS